MRDSVRRIITLTKRNLKEILRDPLSLAFLCALPLVMEILFYFLFHRMTGQFAMKYLAPGIVVFSQSFLTLFAGLLIALDKKTSFLTRLYVSPARPFEFIFGYGLALLPIAFSQSILFFLVGGAIDPTLFSAGMLLGIVMTTVTSLLFIGLGILLGFLCNEKSVGGVSSIVIAGQSILSGMWFPQEGLGKGFLVFMKCLPFKNATQVAQSALAAELSFDEFGVPLLITAAYIVLVFVSAIIIFGIKKKKQ